MNFFLRHKIPVFLFALIILTIPSVVGLINAGFPLTDDGNWMVIRFSAFYETLRSGQFPVRFLMRLNNGYGYPVADFLYPLFMYVGVFIHVLGISFINTIKIIFAFSLFSSTLFSYLWLKKYFDDFSAAIGALFYTYFPYHLFDVYKRGSIGEVLSLSIFPFILWQLEKKNTLLTSLGIAFLVLSHNTLAALFIAFIAAFALVKIYINKFDKSLIKHYLLSLTFGLLMSAFFWIPALFDLQFTIFTKTKISDVSGYFSSFDLIGLSTFLVIFSTTILLLNKKYNKKHFLITGFMLLVSFISLFLSSFLSDYFWKILPASFIQFPFRLLSLTIISVSFLTSFLIFLVPKRFKIAVSILLLVLLFISSYSNLTPKSYQFFPDSFYSTNQDTTTVKNEYMPKWVKSAPTAMFSSRVENITGKEKINLLNANSKSIEFSIYATSKRIVQVNVVYFPGWQAFVNGKLAKIDYEKNGLINLNLDKGNNNVKVIFSETPIRLFSDILSIIGLLGLLTVVFWKKIKHEVNK